MSHSRRPSGKPTTLQKIDIAEMGRSISIATEHLRWAHTRAKEGKPNLALADVKAALTALSRAIDYADLVMVGGVDPQPDEDGVSLGDWLDALHAVVLETSVWHRSLQAGLGVLDEWAVLAETDWDLQSQRG